MNFDIQIWKKICLIIQNLSIDNSENWVFDNTEADNPTPDHMLG